MQLLERDKDKHEHNDKHSAETQRNDELRIVLVSEFACVWHSVNLPVRHRAGSGRRLNGNVSGSDILFPLLSARLDLSLWNTSQIESDAKPLGGYGFYTRAVKIFMRLPDGDISTARLSVPYNGLIRKHYSFPAWRLEITVHCLFPDDSVRHVNGCGNHASVGTPESYIRPGEVNIVEPFS
jgi:hypothetical protein